MHARIHNFRKTSKQLSIRIKSANKLKQAKSKTPKSDLDRPRPFFNFKLGQCWGNMDKGCIVGLFDRKTKNQYIREAK